MSKELIKIEQIDKLAIGGALDIIETEGIKALIDLVLKETQVEIPLKHYLIDGMYSREIFLPKGSLVIGAKHKGQYIETMVSGTILLLSPEKKVVHAPFTRISKEEDLKIGYILQDSIWVTHHPVKAKTVREAEEETVHPDFLNILRREELICQ